MRAKSRQFNVESFCDSNLIFSFVFSSVVSPIIVLDGRGKVLLSFPLGYVKGWGRT